MKQYVYAAVAMAAAVITSMQPAHAQRARVGTLACNLAPTVGFIIGSQQQMSCTFRPSRGRAVPYAGTLSRIGLDVGFTRGGQLVWGVLAATSSLSPRALAGNYVGASGDVSLGVGAGANVLVGGFNRTIVLQPVSVEATAGVNLAVGVAELSLR
jgi:uncharacterized protein DUF992